VTPRWCPLSLSLPSGPCACCSGGGALLQEVCCCSTRVRASPSAAAAPPTRGRTHRRLRSTAIARAAYCLSSPGAHLAPRLLLLRRTATGFAQPAAGLHDAASELGRFSGKTNDACPRTLTPQAHALMLEFLARLEAHVLARNSPAEYIHGAERRVGCVWWRTPPAPPGKSGVPSEINAFSMMHAVSSPAASPWGPSRRTWGTRRRASQPRGRAAAANGGGSGGGSGGGLGSNVTIKASNRGGSGGGGGGETKKQQQQVRNEST